MTNTLLFVSIISAMICIYIIYLFIYDDISKNDEDEETDLYSLEDEKED